MHSDAANNAPDGGCIYTTEVSLESLMGLIPRYENAVAMKMPDKKFSNARSLIRRVSDSLAL